MTTDDETQIHRKAANREAPHREATNREATQYRWEGVDLLPYKEDERALFKAITRQVLFSDPKQSSELRYFEVAPGGFSTLERHEHTHSVLILRGRGHCLVDGTVRQLNTNDLISVPSMAWHQFRAAPNEPLGFLCMVNSTRDKPQLPTGEELATLQRDPAIAAFLRGDLP
jgi:quercetin dioxygenase-like cupin family protein